MIFLFFSTLLSLLGILIIAWVHFPRAPRQIVRLGPVPPKTPKITIIVPARDEERNIRRCVKALLAQTYPNFELIVLDDHSKDATPGILKELAAHDPRLQVLGGEELPPGWVGKTHALDQAAAHATGEWLCFVDADTFVSPEALSSVYAAADEAAADLFSILTFQEVVSFWEKTVLPVVFTAISVGFSPRRVNDPHTKDAMANGQFILIKRAVYTAVGGHAALRDSIVEDVDLALRVKHSGFRLILADGRLVARTRMYTALSEMWEGWTKNIYLGLRDSPGMLALGALGAFLSVCAALALPLWLASGVLWWISGSISLLHPISVLGAVRGISPMLGGGLVSLEAALIWADLLWTRFKVCREMMIPGGFALTTPLGAAVFAAMMIASAWKVLSGSGVTWKGRRYSEVG